MWPWETTQSNNRMHTKTISIAAVLAAVIAATAFVLWKGSGAADLQSALAPAAVAQAPAAATPLKDATNTDATATRVGLSGASDWRAAKPAAPREFVQVLPHVPPTVRGPVASIYPAMAERPASWRDYARGAQTITVSPPGHEPLTFEVASIKDDGRVVTWQGLHADLPGYSLSAVATEHGTFDSILIIPAGSQFSFHTQADGTTISMEASTADEDCGANHTHHKPSHAAEPRPQTAANISFVDVLFVYDSVALSAAQEIASDGAAYLEGQYRARLEAGNVVLGNSNITTFQWRFAGILPAPSSLTLGNKLTDYLTAMSGTSEFGLWLRQQRTLHGGDQAVLLMGANPTDGAGMAYVGSQSSPTGALSAVSAIGWSVTYKTLIHELGHNFGCQHDRETAQAADGNGLHNFGQTFTTTRTVGETVYTFRAGTIMAYSSYTIPYFSNPNITVEVTSDLADAPHSDLNWGVQALGVAPGQPKAAYNAQVMSQNASAVANFYEYPESAPQITTHPVSQTVAVGAQALFSVTATGGALSYQWFKDGVPIQGATTLALSRFATDADFGVYRVVVSNRHGSATSNDATLTKSATQTPPPSGGNPGSGSGGGGGGGGGGAPSIPFIAVILGALLFRFLRRKE